MKSVLDRAMQGDRAVLPDLKKAFDDNPEWIDLFGDLAEQARQSQLHLLAGSSLVAKEAVVRKTDQIRTRLEGDCASPLDSLLIERICLDWMAVHSCEINLSDMVGKNPGAHPVIKASGERLEAAHRRFLASLKALATIRKLLRPVPSTLDMLRHPTVTPPTRTAPKRDILSVAEGVPVQN